MVATIPTIARAQFTSAAAAREALQQEFPGVRFHEAGGRIRAVYGVPMTAGTPGASPQVVAETWLGRFAAVFGEPSPDLHIHSVVRTKSGKTIVSLTQRIDGLPVPGSMVTVVVPRPTEGRIAYASARVGVRPANGLGPALITASQAALIAQTCPLATGITRWSPAEECALYDDSWDSPVARRAFKLTGGGGLSAAASVTVYVDARSGVVLRCHSNVVAFDVSGTVTGKGTGANYPLSPDTWSLTASGCPNPTTNLGGLPQVKVTAFQQGTSQALASTFTASNGTYSIPLASGQNVDIRAEAIGPYWRVRDGSNWDPLMGTHCCHTSHICCPLSCCQSQGACCHPVAPVEAHSGNPVSSTATGINIEWNTTYSEYRTAHVNALFHIEKTNTYVQNRLDAAGCDCYVPGLHDVVDVITNYSHAGIWGGTARASPEFRTLWMGHERGPPTFTPAPNHSSSMILSHEYGHYLIYWMRAINTSNRNRPFHEGFADVLSMFVHDGATTYAPDSGGCGTYGREPLDYENTYPDCAVDGEHIQGMLLSHAWLDILAGVGLSTARQLHVDWMLLTDGGDPEDPVTLCPTTTPPPQNGRSAHPGTVIEVLTADDDDGDFSNGTPHLCIICAAFQARGIACPLSGCDALIMPWNCRADCDRDGALTSGDFLCFRTLHGLGDMQADCNGDGVVQAGDFTCFIREYGAGCEKR